MPENEAVIVVQREFFGILEEFFRRATGSTVTEFATIDTFGDRIRASAQSLAARADDAYSFASKSLAEFYEKNQLALFAEARRIGGMKLVLGGASRFGESQLSSVRKMLLYADTILIPDPILPWIEVARSEERFKLVLFLQTAFSLLQLKPLIDADLFYPAIVLFPSYEKSLEDRDLVTQRGIRRLAAGILSSCLGKELGDGEELERYVIDNQAEFMHLVENHNLYVAPEGEVGQPLSVALPMYKDLIRHWRSAEYQAEVATWPDSLLLFVGFLERIAPQYHLMENAQELGASPLTSLRVQWHYYLLTTRHLEKQLKTLGLIDEQTISTIRAINQQDFFWLGNISVPDLVRLRLENENELFRKELKNHVSELHRASLGDLDRVTAEVSRAISSLIAQHQRDIRAIQQKYQKSYGNTAIAASLTLAATFVPALAPFIGVVAPLAIAGSYLKDKMSERADRQKAAGSIMGILASAEDSR